MGELKESLSDEKINIIVEKVVIHFGVTIDEIKGSSRKVPLPEVRMYLAALLKIKYNVSLVKIGEVLMKCNHTAPLHMISKFTGLKDSKSNFISSKTKSIFEVLSNL